MITPDEISRLRECLRNNSNDAGVILTHVTPIFSLLDEIERLTIEIKQLSQPDNVHQNVHECLKILEPLEVVGECNTLVCLVRKAMSDLSAALKRAEAAEEDADTLAELLNASLDNGEPRTAPEDMEIEALCLRLGFGAVLSSAARLWARRDDTGAFTLGHCRAIVGSALANHEIAKGSNG